jgi:radical SAM superfamily enzyme
MKTCVIVFEDATRIEFTCEDIGHTPDSVYLHRIHSAQSQQMKVAEMVGAKKLRFPLSIIYMFMEP